MKALYNSIIAIILMVLGGCSSYKSENGIEESAGFCLNEFLKTDSKIEVIGKTDVVKHINLTGEVDYNPDKVFHFTSLTEGFAQRVLFSLGEYVEKGQLLAEIQSPELIRLMTEKNRLIAEIKAAQRELKAVQSMYNDQLTTERELVSVLSELEKLQAEQESIHQSLKFFNYNAEKNVFEIRASVAGYVIEKNVTPGMQINSGDDLFTISELSTVWVMAKVYAANIQQVAQGMSVEIKISAYPDDIFEGEISDLLPVFDSKERVLKAKIVIENEALKLKPGMMADILIKNQTGERAYIIPVDNVIFDDNQYFILVYHSDCNVEIRPIHIYARNSNFYYLNEGIKDGEKIITQNQLLIYEKLKS